MASSTLGRTESHPGSEFVTAIYEITLTATFKVIHLGNLEKLEVTDKSTI
jgi:hypothetical protein